MSTAEVSEVLGKFPGVVEANVYGVSLPGHDGKAGAAAIYLEAQHKEKFDHEGFLRCSSMLSSVSVPTTN